MPKIEILPLLDEIEKERGIKKSAMLKIIEKAISDVFKIQYSSKANVRTSIDPNTGEIRMFTIKKVVKEVKDESLEVSLEDALKVRSGVTIDSEIEIPIDIEDFSRSIAHSVRQVIVQKVKEIERDNIYETYKPKEMKIVSGVPYKFVHRDVIVDLGKGVDAVLPFEEQIPRERYRIGSIIKALILKVESLPEGTKITLSRVHQDFIKKLFENEIPEIRDKIVEIVKVVRNPGVRTKVALISHDPKVDPVGACIGLRGSRIKSITDELWTEKVDLIAFSDEPEKYIAEALSPAEVKQVNIIDRDRKKAEVIVSEQMYSVAIGKNNENLKMASELTGWDIEVKAG